MSYVLHIIFSQIRTEDFPKTHLMIANKTKFEFDTTLQLIGSSAVEVNLPSKVHPYLSHERSGFNSPSSSHVETDIL